jgi:hypothetical protein
VLHSLSLQVQTGRDLGWAYFRSPGLWAEYSEGAWHKIPAAWMIFIETEFQFFATYLGLKFATSNAR